MVTENKIIPHNFLVVGSPGKIVRQVSSEEAKSITENTIHYQDNWKKYSKSVFKKSKIDNDKKLIKVTSSTFADVRAFFY